MSSKKINLNLHSYYSLLNGTLSIDELLLLSKDKGYEVIALTDFNAMFGAVEFVEKATKAGIKPITGCTFNIVHEGIKINACSQIRLLCMNEFGYTNICKLMNIAYRNSEGVTYRPNKAYYIDRGLPFITLEDLEKYHSGLICIASTDSDIFALIFQDEDSHKNLEINHLISAYKNIFDDNFYMEIDASMVLLVREYQIAMNYLKLFINFARSNGIKLIAGNKVLYKSKEDIAVLNVLSSISNKRHIGNAEIFYHLMLDGLAETDKADALNSFICNHFMEFSELEQVFKSRQECIFNLEEIADKCNFTFDFSKVYLPVFNNPEQLKNKQKTELKTLAISILNDILDGKNNSQSSLLEHPKDKLMARLEYELNTIYKMGYDEYILIVWDFIKKARELGISVGPGRGSSAGSLVCYLLGITRVDPIRYGLIFERFLNEERISMPDIDVDFEDERRHEIIEYVKQRYGDDKVSKIGTLGTLKPKAALRDVARVFNKNLKDTNYLISTLSDDIVSIRNEFETNPRFKKEVLNSKQNQQIYEMASKLENAPRNVSTHAAGVLITSIKIDEYVPLYIDNTTQYQMEDLSRLGLLKFDFLGLKTLSVIKNTVKAVINRDKPSEFLYSGVRIKQFDSYKDTVHTDLRQIFKGHQISDYVDFPFDKRVFEMIGTGNTIGCFQIESVGMRAFLRKYKPYNFDDIIAGISLYRPGPMQFIDMYLNNKKRPDNIKYPHPLLKGILDSSYGIILYQEQVMAIVRELAGFSYSRSDVLRNAMSKKNKTLMEKERASFIYGDATAHGAVKNGVSENVATQIYDEMIEFSKYAFPKAHATAYGMLAYQSAFLKTFYPIEFMSELINSYISMDFSGRYISECLRMGINILPPDINKSSVGFTREGNSIRFGFLGIKNIGNNLAEQIINIRRDGDFKSIDDFIERVPQNMLNKMGIEALIYAGAFDNLPQKFCTKSDGTISRANLLDYYPSLLTRKRENTKQLSFFSGTNSDMGYTPITQFTTPELANYHYEYEYLGGYYISHPLDEYQKWYMNMEAKCSANDIDLIKIYGIGDINSGNFNIKELKEETQLKQIKKLYQSDEIIFMAVVSDIKTVKRENKYQVYITFSDKYDSIKIYGNFNLKKGDSVIVKAKQVFKGNGNVDMEILSISPLNFQTLSLLKVGQCLIKLKYDKTVIDKINHILLGINSNKYRELKKSYNLTIYIFDKKLKREEKALYLTDYDIRELTNLVGVENIRIREDLCEE